jgi:DegV family protein with EDD domain
MKIVVDSGVDLCIPEEKAAELGIYRVPLSVTFKGRTYREGFDLSSSEFYSMLGSSNDFPITSQPSPGLIAETFKTVAAKDPDILSIHMSSGLSGTYNAAQLAARLVPTARITVYDTKTLSVTSGWQALAARAIKLGWPKEKIIDVMKRISDAADTLFTLKELRYLVHGGRISHLKGMVASLLNIKPIIGVEKTKGIYSQMGQGRNFSQAIDALANVIARQHAPGTALRAQVVHGQNPEGAAMLQKAVDKLFTCKWLPTCPISMVLGAHTGPSVVGLAYAPESIMSETP